MTIETRRRIFVALASLSALAMTAGVTAQHRWDAQCEAEQPGTRWNGDDWLCVSR